MQELAAVPEAAEARLLVVLAHVGRKVRDGDGADVGGRLDRPDLPDRRVRVLGDEGLVVGSALVRARALGAGGGGGGGPSSSRAEKASRAHAVAAALLEPVRLLGGVIARFDVRGAVGGELGGHDAVAGGAFSAFGGGRNATVFPTSLQVGAFIVVGRGGPGIGLRGRRGCYGSFANGGVLGRAFFEKRRTQVRLCERRNGFHHLMRCSF